ncbi:MAG: polymerase subunit epsilon [Acidimicrobiaceae bacterium]
MHGQRSFDDLGTPLHQVTFCVVDLETTGGDPGACAITEIGAVKLCGGECLGTFQTLVNPGCAIPPSITVLTGISETMVLPAPRVETVLPALLEFVGGSVLVGHNLRFDVAFLDGALERAGYPRLANARVDTVALARRLVRDEVPDCRLGTLASRLRLAHRPSHRALDDALATGDLLHFLLERAASLGVLGLDDLVALPSMGGHPQAAKLRLTASLPRRPGVYVFRDRGGRPLYVGKATDLRSRVRSYFSTDDRRKIGQLLRETERIDHVVCSSTLEAAVLEGRLIRRLLPRFNRQGTRGAKAVYLKLTLGEPFPRLAIARSPRLDGGLYLGPLPSARVARLVADAIETAAPLRRCTTPIRRGRTSRDAPCASAQLGVATCPCAGAISEDDYRGIVGRVIAGLTVAPSLLLEPLEARMMALADAERFEEAAEVRDRTAALVDALRRQRRLDAMGASGRIEIEVAPASGATVIVEIDGGRLLRSWRADELALGTGPGGDAAAVSPAAGPPPEAPAPGQPVPSDVADELACVAAWLDHNAGRVRLLRADGQLASVLPALPKLRAHR